MTAQDVCGGGSCGTVVGTKPATVPPPTLTSCTEYDAQGGAACDPLGTTNNPWISAVAVSPVPLGDRAVRFVPTADRGEHVHPRQHGPPCFAPLVATAG